MIKIFCQLITITWNQPSLNEIVIFMFSKFTFTFNLRTWNERDNILLHYDVTNGQNFSRKNYDKVWEKDSLRFDLSSCDWFNCNQYWIKFSSPIAIMDGIFMMDTPKNCFPESCSWRVRFLQSEIKNDKYLTRITR